MRQFTAVSNRIWSLAMVLLLASGAAAAESRPLSIAGLAMASNAIVIGQVDSITAGRDPATGGIYTYITLQASEIWKGSLGLGPITIKQLGGRLDNEGLMVPGQATFEAGEHVLVFLEARPRDRTLYTSALWQGKWSITIDPATNERMAFKREPDTGAVTAGGPLSFVSREVSRVAALGSATTDELNVAPIEQPTYAAAPFVLYSPLIRWVAPVVTVNIATGGQTGLAGGGVPEINAAIAQWNAAGSSIRLTSGSRVAPRCLDSAGFAGILVTFNDPCGEISSEGGLLALASFGYQFSGGQTIGGRFFLPITDAVITTSSRLQARPFLTSSPCFQSTMAHELGHAIGFDHTPDPTALMYFAETGVCFSGPIPLSPDDLAGLFTLYPPGGGGGGGAPGQPTVTSASAVGGILNWPGRLAPVRRRPAIGSTSFRLGSGRISDCRSRNQRRDSHSTWNHGLVQRSRHGVEWRDAEHAVGRLRLHDRRNRWLHGAAGRSGGDRWRCGRNRDRQLAASGRRDVVHRVRGQRARRHESVPDDECRIEQPVERERLAARLPGLRPRDRRQRLRTERAGRLPRSLGLQGTVPCEVCAGGRGNCAGRAAECVTVRQGRDT